MFLEFNSLPTELKNSAVENYHAILNKKRGYLFLKRLFDIIISIISIFLLILPMAIISVVIKSTTTGPIFYLQERVTTYGKVFKILKFRTMYENSDKGGIFVTQMEDERVTPLGHYLRKFRLDELPQIFHVFSGKMSLVGTRPEVPKYVAHYTNEMLATLLMPAGITSLASINFKNEDYLLKDSLDPESDYINVILPQKMAYNLDYIKNYNLLSDFKLIVKTVYHVILK